MLVVDVLVGAGSVEAGTVLSVVAISAAAVVDGTGDGVVADASGSVVGGDEVRSPPQPTASSIATTAEAPHRRNTTHLLLYCAISQPIATRAPCHINTRPDRDRYPDGRAHSDYAVAVGDGDPGQYAGDAARARASRRGIIAL
jgi:hypothetical protein